MQQHSGAWRNGIFPVAGTEQAAATERVLEQRKLGAASFAPIPVVGRVVGLGVADASEHRSQRNRAFGKEDIVFAEWRRIGQAKHKRIEISTS